MRRLRLGMVGGGQGAFIGAVHRIAARLDDRYELVAGAFASDAERARASAAALHVAPGRAYATWRQMAEAEPQRTDGVEVVAIVTPNHRHAEPAMAFLKAGIHVICDKPLAHTLESARALEAAAKASTARFLLTHNYTGYPLVRQARAMVADGAIGAVRIVQVEYAQDWLTTALESTGQKQAEWRTDPARSGAAGSVGDIGTHAFNLAEFVTGLAVESLASPWRAPPRSASPPPSRCCTPIRWCMTTCRRWTMTICGAASPPATRPSMKRPRSSPATRCRRTPSACWPRRTRIRTRRSVWSWCAAWRVRPVRGACAAARCWTCWPRTAPPRSTSRRSAGCNC
ncbi:Gfo/Idh/MocA family oxidoreductase [Leptolyngbya sp. 15MV]|nr:Gfo/Idh/MocA family oxidoreductase [Leptolyngbya sp. 15MV]